MRTDKALRFLSVAKEFAQVFSRDRSTKVGAMLLDSEDYTELCRGYNGMPRGARDDLEERYERPLKYKYTEHAERNAIFNAVRPMLQRSIVVTTAALEMSCARAMISVGASTVYYAADGEHGPDHVLALTLMRETGMRCVPTREGRVVTSECPHPGEIDALDEREVRKVHQYLALAPGQLRALAKDPAASLTVFLSPGDFTVLSTGYSGMPRGADDAREERYLQRLREYWVEGATRNAIYSAARRLLKGSTAIVTATPCADCARALAASGVKHIVHYEPDADFVTRWSEQLREASNLLSEVGVSVTPVPSPQQP